MVNKIMTPKEKAIELVNEFKYINYDLDDIINHKECALIAVNEILSIMFEKDNIYYFYLEVKQEIENLI
jgi:hypothetical protein